MFAGEIPGSLFVSGEHFSGPYRDQRRLPTVLGLVSKQVQYPHLSPLLLTVFLTYPGVWRCGFLLDLSLHPLCIWRSPGFIWDLFKGFVFLVKALFFRLVLVWHFGKIWDQTVPLKVTSLQPIPCRTGAASPKVASLQPILSGTGLFFSKMMLRFSSFNLFLWKGYTRRRFLFFPGKDSANEKPGILFSLAFPTSSSLYKSVFLPLTCRDLCVAHHDYRLQIAILCWSQINPPLLEKYLAVFLFQVNAI